MSNKKYKIENVELIESYIGSKVTYVPEHAKGNASHSDSEGGTIMSWNYIGVMVDYTINKCRTPFHLLVWG